MYHSSSDYSYIFDMRSISVKITEYWPHTAINAINVTTLMFCLCIALL